MSQIQLINSTKLEAEAKTYNMIGDEYARWLCLLEGIDIVSKRVEQLTRRSGQSDIDWIKPLAFQKYIDERFLSMKSDLDEIEASKRVRTIKFPCTTSQAPVSV